MEEFQDSSALTLALASLNFSNDGDNLDEKNGTTLRSSNSTTENGTGTLPENDPSFWNEILTMSVCKGTNGATLTEIIFSVTKWIVIVEGYSKVSLLF